jgi:hypothetical protein
MAKNRKGDVAITILVMLVLALAVSTLVILYLADKKLKDELKSPEPVLNLYAEKEIVTLYFHDTLRQSIAESYENIATIPSYITPVCELAGGKKVFCGISLDWKENLETETRIKFLQKLDINSLKARLREKGIEIEVSASEVEISFGNNFMIKTKNITLVFNQKAESGKKEIIIRHVFNISDEISLESIGLVDFNAVYAKANECKPLNFKDCFKIENFDAVIDDKKISDKDYYEVKMASKQKFFLDNQLKAIELSFLIAR